MIADGADVNTVKEICGHKSLKTTMDYVHLLGGAVKKVAKLFGIGAKGRAATPPPTLEPPQIPTAAVASDAPRPRMRLMLVK